jgi:hypothetical protein
MSAPSLRIETKRRQSPTSLASLDDFTVREDAWVSAAIVLTAPTISL